MSEEANRIADIKHVIKYAIYIAVVFGGLLLIRFIDYRKLYKYSNIFYAIGTAIVGISVIYHVLNTDILIIFRFSRMQILSAIAYAIPMYIIAFAGYLQDINEKGNRKSKIIKATALTIASIVLIALIPFVSLALILGLVYIVMAISKFIYVFKEKGKNNLVILGKALIGFSVFIIPLAIGVGNNDKLLADKSNPTKFTYEDGYYTKHQTDIISEAKLFGTAEVTMRDGAPGLQNGKFEDFVEIGTDYALLLILGHYGWIAFGLTTLIIVLLNVFLIYNVSKIKDEYGKMLGIGISGMFAIQSVFSILMNLNIGIKGSFGTPFISYGMRGMLINMVCIGIVLAVYRRKDILAVKSSEKTIGELLKFRKKKMA